MQQMTLTLDPPRARTRDPLTSHRAARNARQFAAGHAALIIDALASPGTYKEIAERCGLERHAVARRLKELETAGRVRRTAAERDGCAVWEAA